MATGKIAASYLVRIQLRLAEDDEAPTIDPPTLTQLADAISEKLVDLVPGATVSATAERLDE